MPSRPVSAVVPLPSPLSAAPPPLCRLCAYQPGHDGFVQAAVSQNGSCTHFRLTEGKLPRTLRMHARGSGHEGMQSWPHPAAAPSRTYNTAGCSLVASWDSLALSGLPIIAAERGMLVVSCSNCRDTVAIACAALRRLPSCAPCRASLAVGQASLPEHDGLRSDRARYPQAWLERTLLCLVRRVPSSRKLLTSAFF